MLCKIHLSFGIMIFLILKIRLSIVLTQQSIGFRQMFFVSLEFYESNLHLDFGFQSICDYNFKMNPCQIKGVPFTFYSIVVFC